MSKIQHAAAPVVSIGVAAKDDGRVHRSKRTLFRRWLDAVIEARMRKAQREIQQNRKLLPDDVLHRAGYRVVSKKPDGFTSDR